MFVIAWVVPPLVQIVILQSSSDQTFGADFVLTLSHGDEYRRLTESPAEDQRHNSLSLTSPTEVILSSSEDFKLTNIYPRNIWEAMKHVWPQSNWPGEQRFAAVESRL